MDDYYMNIALDLARKAFDLGEVPVGAVIVKDNIILSTAYNKKNSTGITTNHAEILAISEANKKIGDWRLNGCTMYVSLMPCDMCMGAIKEARIEKVIYACDRLYTVKDVFCSKIDNENIVNTSTDLLKKFFKIRR